MAFLPVTLFEFVGLLGQSRLNRLDEIPATGRQSAQTNDSVSFGVVVGYGQDLAVNREPMRGPLNQIDRRSVP